MHANSHRLPRARVTTRLASRGCAIIGLGVAMTCAGASVVAADSREPIARSGRLSVYAEQGGAATAPEERWHLRVVDATTGKTSSLAVPDTDSYYLPTLQTAAMDAESERLSLLFPESAIVVDLKTSAYLTSFPGYAIKASPNGRLLTFIEHYPKDAPPRVETRRLLDVRSLRPAATRATLEASIATGRAMRPDATSSSPRHRTWANQSATTWLSNEALAFAAYDSASDARYVVVLAGLPENPTERVVELDADALVRDKEQARSAAEALRVQTIKQVGTNPLRLRLRFRDDYLLNARTLDVNVP